MIENYAGLCFDEKIELADNPKMSVEDLAQLAGDPYWNARTWAAENRNTPVSTLEQLAQDPARDVRWQVARNPNSSLKALVLLWDYERKSGDPDIDVLKGIYGNAHSPDYLKAAIATKFPEVIK